MRRETVEQILEGLFWLATGFYRVEPDEQGIELLFGKWNNINY